MFLLEFEPLVGKPIVCDPIFLLTEIKESPKISEVTYIITIFTFIIISSLSLMLVCLCIQYRETWSIKTELIEYVFCKCELNLIYYLPVTIIKPSEFHFNYWREDILTFLFLKCVIYGKWLCEGGQKNSKVNGIYLRHFYVTFFYPEEIEKYLTMKIL